jgi:uncharacterized protein (DUF1810 family)
MPLNQASPNSEPDPFDLNRFLQAQDGLYDQALAELNAGRKESHWMWFIFPQIDGLGRSSTARFYAIKSLPEAKAYLNHPLLGPRIIACAEALLKRKGTSAADIFGYPDDLKLRSSMTLFACIADPDSVFARVLGQYFEGQPDQQTIDLLRESGSG